MYLYSRYKQATEGPCNIPQPGFLQYKARAKWNAWNVLGNLSADAAMQQYVQKVTELAPDWTNKVSNQGYGPRVSRPVFAEENPSGEAHDQKSTPLIEKVKDGKLEPVVEYIQKNPLAVHEKDGNGLTPLHWAVDRGFHDIVTTLIDNEADINVQDVDKQTPLHYACSCRYREIAILLLDRGARVTIRDAEGELPDTNFLNN